MRTGSFEDPSMARDIDGLLRQQAALAIFGSFAFQEDDLAKILSEATPRQLELFGFPKARDPFWTPEYVAGMEKRYPGFRGDRVVCEALIPA